MSECKCFEIEREIREKFPDADWNVDAACHMWQYRVCELEDTGIEGEEYCCNCPTCGRTICGWCQ